MIDTLKFARHMQDKGGMTQQQAEAMAEAIRDAALEQLVTKRDLELAMAGMANKLYAVAFGIVIATGVLNHVWK